MVSNMWLCCFFLAMSQGWCTTMEPEPGMYSTSMEPEPGMSSTMAPSSSIAPSSTMAASTSMANGTSAGNGTTGAATSYQHTVGLTITISNLSGKTEAQLINELTTALQSGGDAAEVSIVRITVETSMGGLPTPFDYNNYIEAFAKMCSRPNDMVQLKSSSETNYTSYSSSGGRRLNTDTGDFRVHVEDSASTDVVTASNTVLTSITITALTDQLNTLNSTKYGSLNLTVETAPGMKVVVQTKIISTSATPPTDAVISNQITTTVDGATVTVTSVVTDVAPSTTTAPSIDENSASLASLLTFWVAIYVFLMN